MPLIPININLSARQLWQQDLSVRVATQLKAYDLPPGLMGFEIGERTLLEKPHQAGEALKRLRRLGGEMAINDFGTGHVALGYLPELPIGMIKLDRRFVQRLDSGQRGSAALLAAVISLARELELRMVAVGVETEAQRTVLMHHGVDLLQGFLIGRPLPAASFTQVHLGIANNVLAHEP